MYGLKLRRKRREQVKWYALMSIKLQWIQNKWEINNQSSSTIFHWISVLCYYVPFLAVTLFSLSIVRSFVRLFCSFNCFVYSYFVCSFIHLTLFHLSFEILLNWRVHLWINIWHRKCSIKKSIYPYVHHDNQHYHWNVINVFYTSRY